jgi:hypothetical protein
VTGYVRSEEHVVAESVARCRHEFLACVALQAIAVGAKLAFN